MSADQEPQRTRRRHHHHQNPVKGEQTGHYLDRVDYRGEVPTGEEGQAVGGEPDGRQPHEGGHALQHHQLHQSEGGESCTDSMHIRMPRSKSWASPGGIAPIEQEKGLKTNNDNSLKESRQAVQESSQGQHGAEKRDTEKKDRDQMPTLQWPPDSVTGKESV
jgi:hypothetical protein